jgi:N-methylhydantoinase B
MPAHSVSLEEEGVVIGPTRIEEGVLEKLAGQMRSPRQRLADLRAQSAANAIGSERLVALARRLGLPRLRSAMDEILDYSERRARAALSALPDRRNSAEDVLEGPDGEDIFLRVTASVEGDSLRLDFTGTDDQIEGNLNCPLSVTRSASLFAVRVLTDPDAPPSAGAYRPITIDAPEGCLLNARPPAAVAAGNVETSSRVADLVISALGAAADAPAQGQGTMNNLTLAPAGDPSAAAWTYYETIGGGQGACAGADGPSAVHVAMSNTLNTPIEALETELPVRVKELSIRRGSGGAGAHRGGDGINRGIEALEPLRFTLLTERRRHRPRGCNGGTDGAPGRNLKGGEELPGKCEGTLEPGATLRIETPGGGGFGEPESSPEKPG